MKKKSKYTFGWFPMILLLLICPFVGQAQDYPQKRIDVDYQNATMRDILTDLTQKTGVEFLYNQDEVKQVKPQTFTMKQVTLKEVLDRCLRDTKFGHKYVDGMVVITLLKGGKATNMVKITGQKCYREQRLPLKVRRWVLRQTWMVIIFLTFLTRKR